MKLRYLMPLAAHIVATVAIGFGQVIPGSCIAWVGLRMVAQDRQGVLEDGDPVAEDAAP
jgi:hypothetical protein